MNLDTRFDRRRFVQATGAAAVATFLAGCSGGDGGDGTTSGDETTDDGGDDSGSDDGGSEFLAEEPDYGGWFDDVDNYEGTVDATGSDSVTVNVGAGSGLSFDPPAIAVSAGTTVVWEWTGEGGGHNVSAESGAFQSETIDEEGHTFEYTFEETGTHEYVCTPHKAVGMKGAVVVR
ncbi:halocyanin domain-containing protein [Halorubrum sp. N11]|uniref:halocyanin domain-containing protein n=1 Tax=Halorubrum sp. N11 TaxID=3402276 RepID=UPI003EBDACB5